MCMLLVSAVLLGTSTFAWFSMNNKVTASGMKVEAKANTQYFVVSASSTDLGNSDNTALDSHEGGITGETDKVYPVSYVKDTAALTALTGKLAEGKYSNGDTPAVGEWYTANSTVYDTAVSDKLANVKKVSLGASDYFLKYTFYVGLAENSDDFTGRLIITAAADTSVNAAVNAVIVINGKATKDGTAADTTVSNGVFGETDNKVTTTGNYYLSAAAATKSYVTVTVYVFVDGANANVKDSATDLTGTFKLTVEGTTAA